jgi:hypothetical protein
MHSDKEFQIKMENDKEERKGKELISIAPL